MHEIKKATCHCGAVELRINLPDGLQNVRRCNCSLCRRKGALMATADEITLTVIRGQENLNVYQWNTKIAKHYFCKTCGIYTHHQRRSNPEQFGFNIGCIDDIDIFSLERIATIGDGAAMSVVNDP